MAETEIVETIYGKYSKYEIVKKTGAIGSAQFVIRKDGKPFRGSYSSLLAAVEAAQEEAG